MKDGDKTTCLQLSSSSINFWNLKFSIDEYLTTRISVLELRLHKLNKNCEMIHVSLLQAPTDTCQGFSKTCLSKGYFTSTVYDGSYCAYECRCNADVCADVGIVLPKTQIEENTDLCEVTFYMIEEKTIL